MTNTKLFAVTGNPILHSKSPSMFNNAFKKMGIDATYFRLAADSAEQAITIFKQLQLSGMNVTAPFKEDIMQYLDDVSEEAQMIGGVNTIVNEDGELVGYNTDHYGVANSILQ
jgi:shikimate dehydrogenase